MHGLQAGIGIGVRGDEIGDGAVQLARRARLVRDAERLDGAERTLCQERHSKITNPAAALTDGSHCRAGLSSAFARRGLQALPIDIAELVWAAESLPPSTPPRRHAFTSDALEEWHRYSVPAFTERMKTRLRNHCEDGHQAWPAKAATPDTRPRSTDAPGRSTMRGTSVL
jgi:hypothetical protein